VLFPSVGMETWANYLETGAIAGLFSFFLYEKTKDLPLQKKVDIFRKNMSQIDSSIWDSDITFEWLTMLTPNYSSNILEQLKPFFQLVKFDGDCVLPYGSQFFEKYRDEVNCICFISFSLIIHLFIRNLS
jgi:hypothetical protein